MHVRRDPAQPARARRRSRRARRRRRSRPAVLRKMGTRLPGSHSRRICVRHLGRVARPRVRRTGSSRCPPAFLGVCGGRPAPVAVNRCARGRSRRLARLQPSGDRRSPASYVGRPSDGNVLCCREPGARGPRLRGARPRAARMAVLEDSPVSATGRAHERSRGRGLRRAARSDRRAVRRVRTERHFPQRRAGFGQYRRVGDRSGQGARQCTATRALAGVPASGM